MPLAFIGSFSRRAFADADARKQELQLREDRILLKETELASLEQSTKAGLKTAQKKVSLSLSVPSGNISEGASAERSRAELPSRTGVYLRFNITDWVWRCMQALAEAEVRLAELEHRKRKLEEAERASEERLAAASKEATAKVCPPLLQLYYPA